LRGARADLARFSKSRFVGADLTGARMPGAILRWTDLSRVRLDDCVLVAADLTSSNLHRASRAGADFRDAALSDVRDTDLERARAEDFKAGEG
jgi:uncharacterized protein YjbI with pentapeptide repeats